MMVCSFMPDDCQAMTPAGAESSQSTTTTSAVDSRTKSLLNSLLSLLRVNAGELYEDGSHKSYDKKTLLRLFIHFRYSNLHFPDYSRNTLISRDLLFSGPDQTAYYVFALHKIIV